MSGLLLDGTMINNYIDGERLTERDMLHSSPKIDSHCEADVRSLKPTNYKDTILCMASATKIMILSF